MNAPHGAFIHLSQAGSLYLETPEIFIRSSSRA